MNYATVCSGAEAFGPAWHELGFRPVFHAEIEPHASAVLRYQYPTVPNYGDFTQIATSDGPAPTRPVQLLCGGTPCQTYSVAGLREGLDSYKGGLTLEFVKLAQRLGAKWLLWENVPGVLSSDGGRAFGTFLGTLAECGYGFAYRVLDLQHFGCPQRRKRVFLVAHSGGDWQSCAAVLFERESLRGDSAPSGKKRPDTTQALTRSFGAGGADDNKAQAGFYVAEPRIADTLTVGANQYSGFVGEPVEDIIPLTANTLKANSGSNQIEETYIPTCYDENQVTSKTNRSNPQPASPCHTLPAKATAPLLTVVASTLTAYNLDSRSPQSEEQLRIVGAVHTATNHSAVRRLTPVECERLMGWADEWTRYGINAKGKQYELADGPRYRICGNGWGQPVVSWIAARILEVEALTNTNNPTL